jgi:hypothetical protein
VTDWKAEVSGGSHAGEPGLAAWRLVAWPTAVVAFVVGGLLLGSLASRAAVTGGILLLVVALVATAGAIGGHSYGPRVEGPLDLSTRIAIGLLGGVLGGLAAAATLWLLALVHFTNLLGVSLGSHMGPAAWAVRAAGGAEWGFLFGVVYPVLPGRGPTGRGVLFSLVPSLYMLFVGFPRLGMGVFGSHAGGLTFALVLVLNLVWGIVIGGSLGWAAGTEVGPVSRLPGEA